MDVAVVGAGIVGLSAARFLAERGHQVTVFEQFSLGHHRGSSHGHSRIVRKSYPDPYLTELMLDAYPMWATLEQQSGRSILHECGLFHFGPEGSPNLTEAAEGLKTLGVPHRFFSSASSKEIFPRLQMSSHEVSIYTPDGGWVDPTIALTATADLLRASGGKIMEGSPVHREELESRFDKYVIAAGSWVRDFVPVPVTVTLQTVGYIACEPIVGPVWIHESPELFYGFPSEPGRFEIKIGVHRDGRTINPGNLGREPSLIDTEALTAEASRLFQIQNPLIQTDTCLYTNTANEDFIFGRLGEQGYFASACSGHGFKFGPWSGRLLADFIDEEAEPEDYPRFLYQSVS